MYKFCNCQDEQGARQKTTRKNLNFLCRNKGKTYIVSLVCKICCDSLPHIRNEAGFRGIKKGIVNVDNYANGVASIHFIHLCLT